MDHVNIVYVMFSGVTLEFATAHEDCVTQTRRKATAVSNVLRVPYSRIIHLFCTLQLVSLKVIY